MKKLLLVLFTITIMLYAKAPNWYLNGHLPSHDRKIWIVGVGEGSTPDEARSSAQAAVAQQLRVNVESTVSLFVNESKSENNSDITEDFQILTKSTIDETVKGIEIVKLEKKNNRHYAFAALNRAIFLSGLRGELQDQQNETESFMSAGNKELTSGNIIPAIENYASAYETILGFYTKKSFYDAISTSQYQNPLGYSPAQVLSEIRSKLSNIYIEVFSGENQTAKIGTWLKEPIVFQTFLQDDGEIFPLKNVSMQIRNSEGNIFDRPVTDIDGKVESFVQAIPVKNNRGYVIAQLRISGIPTSFRKYLKTAECKASYNISESEPIPVSLKIVTESGKKATKLKNKVSKSLSKLGYPVSDEAPFILFGLVSTNEEKEIEGMHGKQFVVKSELYLELKGKTDNTIYETVSFTGTGVSPINSYEASKASQLKISIKKKDLVELMGAAESQYLKIIAADDKCNFEKASEYYNKKQFKKALSYIVKVTESEEVQELIDKIQKEL